MSSKQRNERHIHFSISIPHTNDGSEFDAAIGIGPSPQLTHALLLSAIAATHTFLNAIAAHAEACAQDPEPENQQAQTT